MNIPLPFNREYRQCINNVTDVIEYVRRSALSITNLKSPHKRKSRSTLYHIVESDLETKHYGPKTHIEVICIFKLS